MSTLRFDKELEQYRSLMEVPSTFEDGFNWTSLVGALFVATLMVPGTIYMGLLAGGGIGPAAQWVTVILFIEVARRAHKHLRRAEIFVLFYMASAAMSQPFSGLLYNQFFAQSESAAGSGVLETLPSWFAPTDPDVLAQRSFLNPAWYPVLGMVIFGMITGRLNSAILSYGLFRLASDIEKLPFPMAPIGAQGIIALAEQQHEESQRGREEESESWRWRVFSIGGVLGLSFGSIYTALPALTSAILPSPIMILPIPFVDWTPKTASFLPAVATGLTFDMGSLIFGMVMPFFAVVGSFLGMVIQVIANPLLYRFHLLESWEPNQDTIATLFSTFMDFYFSFGLGITISLAIIGFWQVYRGLKASRRIKGERKAQTATLEVSDEDRRATRGDISWRWVGVTYFATTASYILVSGWLIGWKPNVMAVLLFFGFLYTPLISYVTARLEGTAGQVVAIPYIREAAFILSGYRGDVKIWFLPVPMADYGQGTVFYRQAELTGTKFWSIWKTELVLVPIVLLSSIFFAQFIWSLAPIPSQEYPFAQKMWELTAAQQCIMYTATLGRFSKFEEAFNWQYMAAGTGVGLALFGVMGWLHLPVMLMYGLVRGLSNATMPHGFLPQLAGALIGRFYFERKMGLKWRQYIPVVAAGFACGMGLITVLGVGVNFLAKSVIKIPF